MKAKTNIALISEQNTQKEYMNNNIKAIESRVNERISLIFNGNIKDIYSLHNAVCYGIKGRASGLAVRVWRDLGKSHPGLRDLLFNQSI